jgi:hypothetical protein
MDDPTATNDATTTFRGDNSLGDILYKMAVNFLLYVVLIIVFYMLIRFYLEEDTSTRGNEYFTAVDTLDASDEIMTEAENNSRTKETNETKTDGERTGLLADESGAEAGKVSPGSPNKTFFDFKEWKQEDVTKEEVIKRLVICSLGLIISFTLWGLVQERILTQPYNGDFFEYSYGLVFMTRLGGLVSDFL